MPPRLSAEIIKPTWDGIAHQLRVETATVRGLQDIAAEDEVHFEEALLKAVPDRDVVIQYPDGAIRLTH